MQLYESMSLYIYIFSALRSEIKVWVLQHTSISLRSRVPHGRSLKVEDASYTLHAVDKNVSLYHSTNSLQSPVFSKKSSIFTWLEERRESLLQKSSVIDRPQTRSSQIARRLHQFLSSRSSQTIM